MTRRAKQPSRNKESSRKMGAIYEHDRRLSRVLYSFEMAEPLPDQGEVSGVMISKESVYSPGKTLFLKSKEDQFLKILSIEPISPSAKELAIYRFTAELMQL